MQFSIGDAIMNIEKIKSIEQIFSKYNYVMTTSQLKEKKIYYLDIQKLIEDGFVKKVKRGHYHWIEDTGSEILIINSLFPDAVLCMETALFYYSYSDRNPIQWHITIDKNASRRRTNIEYPFIKAYRVETKIIPLGETSGKIDGESVRIYDRDRTICDVLRNMSKMDKEIFNKAIQNYIKDSKKNIPNLMQYAKELRIQKRVKDLIGVWL